MPNPAIHDFAEICTQGLRNELEDTQSAVVGYFCSYTPIELIEAAGLKPVRLIAGPGPVEAAYSLVPDFVCPFMKRNLEEALGGGYPGLKGIVQGYTCDVACGLVNIWESNIPGIKAHLLPLPYLDNRDSRRYFREELNRLFDQLKMMGGHARDNEKLNSAINRTYRIESLLKDLYTINAEKHLLSASDLYYIKRAASINRTDRYLDLLDKLMGDLNDQEVSAKSGTPLLLSGSVIESVEMYTAMEAYGANIIVDDTCSGERDLNPLPLTGEDPFNWILDRHFQRQPCPSRSRSEERLPILMEKIEERGVRGVVFLIQKFCTPHLSDIPFLTDALKKQGIPSLVVEIDEAWNVTGQCKTRLEGFLETMD